MDFKPFNYGNVVSTGENVLASRENRQQSQQKIQLENTKVLYGALSQIAQNPQSVDTVVPQLKQRGIVKPDFDYSNMPLEQIQVEAQRAAEGIKAGLDAYGNASYKPESLTAPQRNYNQFQKLEGQPDKQANFMNMVRAHQYENLGDRLNIYSPNNPTTPASVVKKGVPPQSTASHEAGVAAAKEEATQKVKARFVPQLESKIASEKIKAKKEGEVWTELKQMEAALPSLTEAVNAIKQIAPLATSTWIGSGLDMLAQQAGFGATEGATAKAKITSMMRNQILPMLRPTFGAAFTALEGEKLEATMLDPNAPLEVKFAQLDSFLTQAERNIRSKETELNAYDDGSTKGKVYSFDAQGNLIK